ncbi:ATP-binding cassette domain-containing protein [Nonomuraea sp. NPDC050394]|uniref:ATP-binding cassette domain-containing protein n=1 Tax=Nonomuraea sp. NPDC050394 TaxID=3364363 RepID=UPI00379C6814
MARLIGLREVSVAYPGTLALDGVSVEVNAGDVLAVVGANGSGKTTMLSTMCGLLAPSGGTLVDGNGPVRFRRPAEALGMGVALVPQEPQVAETLPLWENLVVGRGSLLGAAPARGVRAEARRAVRTALPHLDPDLPAGELRKADRAVLALLRALVREPRVLALDEPTAVLGENGVQVVASAAARVRDRGGAVVLVSHRLRDIVRLATRVVVLIDGRLVQDSPVGDVSLEDLVDRLTTGRSAAPDPRPAGGTTAPTTATATDPPRLRINGLTTSNGLDVTGLEVRPGQILGLAGLGGSGRSRLCRVAAGCERYTGRIEVDGRPLPSTPAGSRHAGIAYVPEDRARESAFSTLSVERNLEVGDLIHRRLARPMPWRPAGARTRRLIADFGIKTAAPTSAMTSLSGGNQQRVVLARVLANRPRLLIADEPTQGVDRSGRRAIHDLLRRFAGAGGAVLLVSSEFEELQELSSRIAVMRDGRIVAELPATTEYRRLVALATGAENSSEVRTHER